MVETLCADLAAEGDCPGAGWNALWEWLTDVVAPAAAAEEAILAPVESQSAACASAFPALAVVSAALMAALVALGIAVYWLRNSRRALRRALCVPDVRTGFLNQEGFRRRFEAKVRADNRASCCVACFHFILGHIERIGGPGEILRFHRFVADVLHRRAVGNMDIGLSKTGDVFVLRQGKSPLSTRKWALHVLDEIRAYECAGAPLNRRDATVGVFPSLRAIVAIAMARCSTRGSAPYAREMKGCMPGFVERTSATPAKKSANCSATWSADWNKGNSSYMYNFL